MSIAALQSRYQIKPEIKKIKKHNREGKLYEVGKTTLLKLKSTLEKFEFNAESIRSFINKYNNYKKYFPNLNYEQIVDLILSGARVSKKTDYGKLESRYQVNTLPQPKPSKDLRIALF